MITDLTGLTWVYDPRVPFEQYGYTGYNVNFEYADGTEFIKIEIEGSVGAGERYCSVLYQPPVGDRVLVYKSINYIPAWYEPRATSITFTGGADVRNSGLIALLEAHGDLWEDPYSTQESKYVGQNAESLTKNKTVHVDRVILTAGGSTTQETTQYYAPQVSDAEWESMTGKIITVSVPYGDQNMAGRILTIMSSIDFVPYKSTCAEVDPAYELGDWVTIGGTYSFIGNETIYLNDMASTDVSALTDSASKDKYPYLPDGDNSTSTSSNHWFARLLALINKIYKDIDARLRALED